MTLREQDFIARFYPRPVRYLAQIGSTNDVALDWMRSGTGAGSMVIADEQVKGKGRQGHSWYAPPGTALMVSLILRPRVDDLSRITMLGALAIYDIVKALGIESVEIKWPNDVILNGLKVSGVLPEAVWDDDKLVGVVLGMGVNVRVDFSATELAGKAISIESVLGRRVDRLELLAELVSRVDYWTAQLGRAELFEIWKSRLVTLGQDVCVKTADQKIVGFAEDVDGDGALFIRSADRRIHRVVAGDLALG